MDRKDNSWFIVTVKKCNKNSRYCVSIGANPKKAVGSPIVISETKFKNLCSKLLGHYTLKLGELKGLSFPRTSAGVKADFDNLLK
jgi:hypothetical protein